MSEAPDRKVYRRPPTWQIRAADGTLRRPGGDGVDWWATSAPVEPEPALACSEPIPIYCEDCTA